ncbi:MAG: PilT/PilU family type 4a pilus ATPase [Lachnospiraceae bacterium]|nr:PilT/PilU family type 4a pilus ATPase [Lachnospiraceae bacterium]MBR5584541.1 PilT/PilU family type 4a pilus ATPase [Lachnospiraceae bacterium]
MDIQKILEHAVETNVSDAFMIAGLPISYRKNGAICQETEQKLLPADTESMITELYALANNRSMDVLLETGDDDFSFSIKGLSRFRVSAFKQRGSLSAVIRIIRFELPDYKELHIPENIMNLANERKGLVLVTGSAGSGKSTTLACIIDKINHSRKSHVITLEDPLEFLHRHNQSIVTQREIQADSESYVKALRAALRQSPDIILLGEMRDYETIEVAMTAAETGHLIFSTLHTIGAANTIERIIDVFPANQQRQIAVQLAMVLNAVVSQQLVPTVDGQMIPVFEYMTVTPAIRTMIRDNKVHQIDGALYASSKEDMLSMDTSLYRLYKEGIITKETALTYATNPEMLSKKL